MNALRQIIKSALTFPYIGCDGLKDGRTQPSQTSKSDGHPNRPCKSDSRETPNIKGILAPTWMLIEGVADKIPTLKDELKIGVYPEVVNSKQCQYSNSSTRRSS